MGRIIEGLKDRLSPSLPTPVESGAQTLIGDHLPEEIMAISRRHAIPEQFGVQRALSGRLAKMGVGTGAEILQLRLTYQGNLAATVLKQLSQGTDMAIIVGNATSEIREILATNDLRERAYQSLNLNHKIVEALDRNKRGRDAFTYLTGLNIFQPWANMLRELDHLAPSLRRKMGELDRTANSTRSNLNKGADHLSSSRGDLLEAAATHDDNLGLMKQMESLRNKAQGASSELIKTVGHRQKPVKGLVVEAINIRNQTADMMRTAAEVHEAEESMLRAAGLLLTDLVGAQTLVSADRGVRLSRASLELGTTALPMLGLWGISAGVEATALWTGYMYSEIARLIAGTRPVFESPDKVIDAIVADWKATLDAAFPQELPEDPINQLPNGSGNPAFDPNQAFDL